MGQVDLNTINSQVKQFLPVIKTAASALPNVKSGEMDTLDKIAQLLDTVTKFMTQYNEAQAGKPAAQAEREPPDGVYPDKIVPPDKLVAPTTPPQSGKQALILQILIPVLEQHLNYCIEINPKMPLGEAISKISFINVSDLKDLLSGIKK